MSEEKIGLVGYGYWGRNYLTSLRDLEGVRLGWVCDLKNEPRPSLMPRGCSFTRDLNTVFSDTETNAVIIATPADTHYALTLEALRAKKNVLVEKPITIRTQEAANLIDVAQQMQKVLMVGHTFNYNPAFNFLEQTIAQGELGEIRYIEARRVGLGPIRKDVSALWDLATHDIYMVLSILKETPQIVSYHGTTHNGKVDDISLLTMKFPNNVIATIYANWEHPIKERRFVVGGTKKAILFDDVQPAEKIVIYNRGVDYLPREGGFGEFQAATRDGDIIIPKIPIKQPLLEEIKHFIDCISKKAQCKSDGLAGLQTVRVLEAAEISKELGGLEVNLE